MKVQARQSFAWVLLLGITLLACGCSTFNREWKSAATQPAADSLAGRWEGKWLSAANGHTGKLRSLVTRETDTLYHAHFRATYWKIFRATYTVTFAGEWHDGAWQFKGTEDLGALAGGVYHYEGLFTPTNFHSTYRCQYDHGTFELTRPK